MSYQLQCKLFLDLTILPNLSHYYNNKSFLNLNHNKVTIPSFATPKVLEVQNNSVNYSLAQPSSQVFLIFKKIFFNYSITTQKLFGEKVG